MRIAKGTCPTIHFTIRGGPEEDAAVVDSTADREPLVYLHGYGNVMPGLERALTGRQSGDSLSVIIPPHDAYGDWREEYLRLVPHASLSHVPDLEVGLQLFAEGVEGGSDLLTIVEIRDDGVVVDGNHPLAGRTLRVDVAVESVREATDVELSRGAPESEDWL